MWTVITAVCLVFVVCSPIWLIARYLKVELPKFLLPMVAGITMLAFNGYMRYTWSDRTAESFPPEVVILKEYRSSTLFEPWTFLVPRISHFIAADKTQTRENSNFPEVIMGATIMMQEHQPTLNMTVLVNCSKQLVSVIPTKQIEAGKNPMDLAEWTGKEQFPYLVDFYCKN